MIHHPTPEQINRSEVELIQLVDTEAFRAMRLVRELDLFRAQRQARARALEELDGQDSEARR